MWTVRRSRAACPRLSQSLARVHRVLTRPSEELWVRAPFSRKMVTAVPQLEEHLTVRMAKPLSGFDDSFEYWLQLVWRARNDGEHIAGGRLVLKRLLQLSCACLHRHSLSTLRTAWGHSTHWIFSKIALRPLKKYSWADASYASP